MSLAASLTIDLDAIAANWRALDGVTAPDVETAAVIKADAYGCGAVTVGRALADAGVRTFFTAQTAGAVRLRTTVGDEPAIYVLGGYVRDDAPLYRDHALRPVLNSGQQAAHWFADNPGAPSAIQLDTGMNRLGMEEAEVPPLPRDGSIRIVMSHLAAADEPESPLNRAQLLEFVRVAQSLDLPGAQHSLAATGGIMLGPDYHFGLVRPGVGLFGGMPFADAQPVVHLSAPVIQVRDVQAGEVVGYGATWVANRPSRIATLSVGYADGIHRAMSNRGHVWHNGRPLPVAGRVSMDLITIDVTDADNITEGDRVDILGSDQSVDQLAEAAGTIGYEVLTGLGRRYIRRYRGSGSEQGPIP